MDQNVLTQDVLLLCSYQWKMTDEKTGDQRDGTTILYIPGSLAPIDDGNGTKGHKVAKASLPYDAFNEVVDAPGLYRVNFTMKTNKDGKMMITPVSLKFIRPLVNQKK
jgi:hypothetical protein